MTADAFVIAGVAVLPLAWYCFVMGMTPGPNNLMLAASGMNFGIRRTLPHILGVILGFSVLFLLVGLGIGALYAEVPALQQVLRWVGSAFLVYLAWRIAGAGAIETPEDATPLRFHEAALFQFANPKAWVFSTTASASFLGDGGRMGALVLCVASMFVSVLSTTTWTLFGAALARLISTPRVQRGVNLGFAIALLATVPLILLP